MSDIFSYLFSGNTLIHTNQGPVAIDSNGYKTFNGGNEVDWTIYDYNGTIPVLKHVVTPVVTVQAPTVKTAAEIAAERQQSLDYLFNTKEQNVVFNFGKASALGDGSNAATYGNEIKNLQSIYGNYTLEITAGNDPLTLYGNYAFTL